MRQQNKPGTRKERLREAKQAKRSAQTFTGTCSKCGDKKVTVTKFKSGQICVSKCLATTVARLSGATPVTADQAIKA